jgi:esterase
MKLAFRETGSGQPIIILHGLFGQSDNWNTFAKTIGEKGFRAITVDQRNHGLSPHSNTWTLEAMAEDLHEFIEEYQLRHPILLGHSMGGKTVMYFEKMFPGISDKVIIVDIAARAYPAGHTAVLKALHAVDLNKISNRKEAETVMKEYLGDFGTRQFLLKNLHWKDAANTRMDWRFNLKVISDNYGNITGAVPEGLSKVPALIVRGERSEYVTENDLSDFKKRFPDSEFVTIEGAGHWVHAEKPVEFFEKVFEFIKG